MKTHVYVRLYKNFFAAICISLLLLAAALGCFAQKSAAHAQQTLDPSQLLLNRSLQYYYLDDVVSVAEWEDLLYVGTEDLRIHTFSLSSGAFLSAQDTLGRPDKLAVYDSANLLALETGKIVLYTTSGQKTLSGVYSDFALVGTILYASYGTHIIGYDMNAIIRASEAAIDASEYISVAALDVSGLTGAQSNKDIRTIIADRNHFYFTVSAEMSRFYEDIYQVDWNARTAERVFEQTDAIKSGSVLQSSLYALSVQGDILLFQSNSGSLGLEQVHTLHAVDFCFYGETLVTAHPDNSISIFEKDLVSKTNFLLSRSSADGFFASPYSAVTRKGNIYVADTMNNRVSVLSGSSIRQVDGLIRPVSVAVDNLGQIYVAHNINTIGVFSPAGQLLRSLNLPDHTISQIFTDVHNNLWIAAGGSLFLQKADTEHIEPVLYPSTVKSIFINFNTSRLYVYDGARIHASDDPLSAAPAFTVQYEGTSVLSFVADSNHTIYALDTGCDILRITGGQSEQYLLTDAAKAKSIALSMIRIDSEEDTDASVLQYGDLLIIDTGRHGILKVDHSALDIKVFDESFIPPDLANDHTADPITDGFLLTHKTRIEADIYEKPIEMNSMYRIAAGSRIFMPDFPQIDGYRFVVYEDSISKVLQWGYVFGTVLEILEYSYTPPPKGTGAAYTANTPVYKYPSVHANIVLTLNKDDSVRLLDFASPYQSGISEGCHVDGYGNRWYRVGVGETSQGFTRADYLSLNNYNPTLRPQTNATIQAFAESTFAFLYYYDQADQQYKVIDDEEPLAAGTRIELVKPPLDPSKEFAEIRFYKEGFGTLTCFVESKYIKYDTVNSLQILAVIIIIVFVILMILIFVWVMRKRKIKY